MMRVLSDVLVRTLGGRWMPWVAAALGFLLFTPALPSGLQLDDLAHRATLGHIEGFPDTERSPADLFVFMDGDVEANRAAMDRGLAPWFTHPGLRLSFFRPVSGFSHALDHALWPDQPWLMHLQSLLWYAALVLVAAVYFRRLLAPAWVAGLAAFLYAIDDAHLFPAAWLANRNALIGGFFGILALVAHDRWRREGSRASAVLAPAALLLGLLAQEGAMAVGGYLLAYALFIDPDRSGPGSRVRRWCSLIPCATVGVVWAIGYALAGHGASGSGLYIDPAGEPLRFLRAVIERAPLLVWGQWFFPAADLYSVLSQSAGRGMWLAAIGLLVVLAALLAPLLRRDRTARFWALGTLLALLPVCGTAPSNRLLVLVGLGSMGLLAQYLAWLATPERWRRLGHRIVFAALLLVHVGLALLGVVAGFQQLAQLSQLDRRMAATLPADDALRQQWLLVVNTPSTMSTFYSLLLHAMERRPLPQRALVLVPTIHELEIRRLDAHTLSLRPRGGLLLPPGQPPDGTPEPPAFHPGYVLQQIDQVFRDPARRFTRGETIALTGLTIEIVQVGEHGRPTEIVFRFEPTLESPRLRWLRWGDHGFEPFAPPPVGGSVTLPAPVLGM